MSVPARLYITPPVRGNGNKLTENYRYKFELYSYVYDPVNVTYGPYLLYLKFSLSAISRNVSLSQ